MGVGVWCRGCWRQNEGKIERPRRNLAKPIPDLEQLADSGGQERRVRKRSWGSAAELGDASHGAEAARTRDAHFGSRLWRGGGQSRKQNAQVFVALLGRGAQPAVGAHAMKTLRQDMLQEAAQELFGLQRAGAFLAGLRVRVAKTNAALILPEQPRAADGGAENIA